MFEAWVRKRGPFEKLRVQKAANEESEVGNSAGTSRGGICKSYQQFSRIILNAMGSNGKV